MEDHHCLPSAAGESARWNVSNFSSERFTASSSGSSIEFSGVVPEDFATSKPSGTASLYMIYPAATVSVASQSTKDSGFINYNIRGLSIPSTQDGTGWKYCWFTSESSWDFAQQTISPATFKLSNCLIKFAIDSPKSIRKIDIVSKNSYMAGDIVLYTGRVAIQTGCVQRTITIENGGILPDEILFACRLLNTHDGGGVTGTEEITFTFTAADGSSAVKILRPSAQYASNKPCEEYPS